jgi:hypothetical protein
VLGVIGLRVLRGVCHSSESEEFEDSRRPAMVIAPKKIAMEPKAAALATGTLFSAIDLMRSERGVFGVVSSSSFELDMVSSFLEGLVLISVRVLFAEFFDELDHGVLLILRDER